MSADRRVDTIAAIATAAGRGAIGILRLSGPRAFDIADRMTGPEVAPRQARLRVFRDTTGTAVDRGLVLRFPGPHSYTGEDVVELQGHGGPVVLNLLLQAACELGARPARAGEFSERAFLNDRLDLAQAEAVADLIDAASRAAVQAAHRSLEGVFSRSVQDLAQTLLELRVYVEGALDFSDEDIDWLADAQLDTRLQQAALAFEDLLGRAAQGRRLRDGIHLAIVGQPNVGKSTLLNALAGTEAAIVSSRPGTTRDVLREHLLIDDLPVTVVDTAGLRDTEDQVEAEGIRRAWVALRQAELVLFLVDDQIGWTDRDQSLFRQIPDEIDRLIVFNKIDASGRAAGVSERAGVEALRLSAVTGAGLDGLRETIRRLAGVQGQVEGTFSARGRHLDALRRAQAHLTETRSVLAAGTQVELAAEELRLAHEALGEITGRVTTDDMLGAVFSRFCIGK
ncbi:tRNA uridine-5-carboxymethylaminomethyl(34) synthesis GTPase MnmE [Panacagrimonas sp.]|uniref:tRNA uridine-5-carboxymethylaminomethyl(34) synthesis GTPase MnmE n=1 Tax=Panacagrimonas sp. TaxID=2480088 RepID=UPI003B52791C